MIPLHDVPITNQAELEGGNESPGMFLKVLQRSAIAPGAMILCDEATWLNEDGCVSAAKRVFNGECARLKTQHFGGGPDGSGLVMPLLPTLVIAASNDPINDPALKSRFDCIEFPSPKSMALLKYAESLFLKSGLPVDLTAESYDDFEEGDIDKIREATEYLKDAKSFRAIEKICNPLIFKWKNLI